MTSNENPTRGGRVSVVVVNYDTRDELRECLASLAGDPAAEIVVVDNASQDDSVDMVTREHPRLRLIRNPVNRGFGGAANQGIAECRTPYVLLLNADTSVESGTLDAVAAYLDAHPRVAIVGPRLVHADGRTQPSAFAFPLPVSMRPIVRRLPLVRERSLRTWSHSHPRRVHWVLGAALGIRLAAFREVGGFDEAFPLYFEDVELCHRLSVAGWEIHFAPVATIMHVGGRSTDQRRTATAVERMRAAGHWYRRRYRGAGRRAVIALQWAVVATWWMRDRLQRIVARDPTRRRALDEDLAAWEILIRKGL